MGKEYKAITLNKDFKLRVINTHKLEVYESNRRYYIKQGLVLFALFLCLFGLILDFEWMAGRL